MRAPTLNAKERLEAALNEARMLVLGGQVVLGFQFEAIFQPKFAALPAAMQVLNAVAVSMLVTALVLLLAPIPYHRLAARGDATPQMFWFTTAVIAATPLPFALAIGMDVAIVSRSTLGVVAAAALTVTALGLWYGVEFMNRTTQPSTPAPTSATMDIHEKIKTINTEARIVLPGVQALLGFQFVAFLTDGFDRLPAFAKQVHLAGLVALGLAAIFLMAPPAYHRIAARGEDRPDVDRFAERMVLGSLAPLAVGLAADLYLVVGSITGWAAWTAAAAGASVAAMLGLWFGYPLWARRR